MARRFIVASFIICASILVIIGNVQTGLQLWQIGLPGWALQAGGYLLFTGIILFLLAEWDSQLSEIITKNEPSQTPADRVARDNRRKRESAIYELTAAAQEGSERFYHSGDLEALRARMQAALVTAQKRFEVDLPKLPTEAGAAIDVATEFLQRISPFLLSGHDEEAKVAGQNYIAGN